MPQSLSKTLIHIIFGTKNRVNFIDDNIESRLFSYIGTVCNDLKCNTIIVGGYRNHIHIFCSLNRTIAISELVKKIKANSSRWIKTQGVAYNAFYWQDGYAVFSVSQSKSTVLIDYIKNQKQHHEKKSFKQEYLHILKANDISFDDEYLWD